MTASAPSVWTKTTHTSSRCGCIRGSTGVGLASSWPRKAAVEAIEGHGKVFYTVYEKGGERGWILGAQVEVVTIERTRYLKIRRNPTKADNLDELAEY